MLRLRWSLAALAIVASVAFADDDAQRAMDVTQEACDAWRRGDLDGLERTLAPRFTLVGSSARVQTRDEVFAEVRAGDTTYTEFRNHGMVAHVYGDAATVQGVTSLAGTSGGQRFAVDVRFTDTLIRRDGGWRIVVSHATRIPATSTP